jgi:hypothetical protein
MAAVTAAAEWAWVVATWAEWAWVATWAEWEASGIQAEWALDIQAEAL